MTWIAVSTQKPTAGQVVLAFYFNEFGEVRRVRAEWQDGMQDCPCDGDCPEADHADEDGGHAIPPGWYENADHSDILFPIRQPVTHWMPLPQCTHLLLKPAADD